MTISEQHITHRAARTAWGPTVQVALEQFVPQPQRIIIDPLAYRFLPAIMRALLIAVSPNAIRNRLLSLLERRVPGVRGGILCRKRYIDDKLMEALKHGIGSLVILGAGMDTRAYKQPELSTLRVYEVDLPEVIENKKSVLRRVFGEVPTQVRFAPVDFDRQDVERGLQEAGFSQEETSFFIWEGVTQYITEAAVRKVFEFLEKARPGSRLVFTYICKDFIDGLKMYDLEVLYRQTRVTKQLWQFGMEPGKVSAFLESYGWRDLEQVGSAEYQERYLKPAGRSMPVMGVERAVYAEKTGLPNDLGYLDG
jgi:methyltransferase (TIGR00027 family)